ncbi:MAG: hypothetical protein KKC75_04935 [Nanoarchaeota archaeon]|nr:hypothetical protein [Nanoarchaeota archaeon]MBU1004569.1 hypothetical protein [Nanoarchaeota archaeon]MBU1946859.1 hypothetical protein [Nanoarchaeota archaeon]
MNKKSLIIFTALLLLMLPAALAKVSMQLGEPYVNIADVSKIEFLSHPDYYELCSLDKVTIPVLIKNENTYSDTFSFSVDKKYASLPVKSAVIGSGKSAVLPLTLQLPSGMKENTTVVLNVVTKKEGLKRSVVIKTNVDECYLFELKLDKGQDEICSCDSSNYALTLQNRELSSDSFTIDIDVPGWVNSTLTDSVIQIPDGQKKVINIEANPPCDTSGSFDISVKAVSGNSNLAKQVSLKLDVIPNDKCYDSAISASDVKIDYLGKNIPVTIKNKGTKDASYSLSVEGVDWYKLSQTEFEISAGSEKTVNLALYPDKSVVEGEYSLDIKTESSGKETVKSIKVSLTSESSSFDKLKFYINYFRYSIGLAFVLLIVLIGLIILLRRKKTSRAVKKKVINGANGEKKIGLISDLKKVLGKIKWLPWILGILIVVILGLIIYSYFKYHSYYLAFLAKCIQLFKVYLVPYFIYWKYAVIALPVIIVLAVIIFSLAGWIKRKKKNGIKKAAKKEKGVIEKKEIVKAVEKKVKGKGLSVFEYGYLTFVILLFLGIIGYVVYKLWGKPVDLGIFASFFSVALSFVKEYYLFFAGGLAATLLILLIISLFRKFKKSKSKKRSSERKITKKSKGKSFKAVRNILIIIVGLLLLGGLAYYLIYYNPIVYIQEFFVLYYPSILMGVGILLILIVILHFSGKKK